MNDIFLCVAVVYEDVLLLHGQCYAFFNNPKGMTHLITLQLEAISNLPEVLLKAL